MSERDYVRYKNVIEFITEWQKFETKHREMPHNEFRKQMQSFHYIVFECYDPKYEQLVHIFLFSENNIYVQANADMKKLLSKFIKTDRKQRIILITNEVLSVYHKKSIAKEKNVIIDAYKHEIFDFILPRANSSSPHRILSGEEISNITNNELFCHVVNLPKIFDTDPQCVWIGAKPGDVLEITMNTDISGNCVRYHLVIPHTFRMTEKNISKELLKNARANMAKYKKQKGKLPTDPIEQKQAELIAKRENPRGLLASNGDEEEILYDDDAQNPEIDAEKYADDSDNNEDTDDSDEGKVLEEEIKDDGEDAEYDVVNENSDIEVSDDALSDASNDKSDYDFEEPKKGRKNKQYD